jgi:CMP-N-acetylneuraminate monooxygenase
VKENLSWDEAKIGYWCRFSRSPNVYHAGFRRLLQAPYFKRPANPPPVGHTPIRASSVIADLIEIHGEQAERVLRRYGMYCAGCQHSTYDSIALGASHHGIEEKQVDRLVQELNQLFSTTPALQD